MSQVLKDNRLPLLISAVALAVAVYIGFVPLRQSQSNTSEPVALVSLSSLNDRIAALEAAPAAVPIPAATQAPDIPEGADNARLRQEIDLIVRGLSNQTGRVSRLKATVEGITDDNGQLLAPARVMDEIALAKRGLANLTRRINELSSQMDALDTAAADITRLQQQMANVDRAFARLARNANEARTERESLLAALGDRPASSDVEELVGIEAKLDAILQQLAD